MQFRDIYRKSMVEISSANKRYFNENTNPPPNTMKKNSCRTIQEISYRELQIKRLELMHTFITKEPEVWFPLQLNPNYLFSNHCRVINLKSYYGKHRIISPSLKYGKYLYYTITVNGTRYSLSMHRILQMRK